MASGETASGRASSESVVRLRQDPEGWLRGAWEEGTHPVLAAGLSTLALGYRAALLVRGLSYDWHLLSTRRLPCPVVSLGNLTVGGSGKTPLVELATLTLVALGAAPAVVSRGYGRSTRGVHVVADRQSVRLGARGDEPLLLAERLPGIPVVVGENRFEAGRHAVETLGASVVVLDDGFQNRTIAKSLEIVVVSARSPWGNGHLFPSGRLREPLSALRRAQLVVVTNPRGDEDVEAVTRTLRLHDSPAPVASARYEPVEARRGRVCRSRSWRGGGCSPSAGSPRRAPSWRRRRGWASCWRASSSSATITGTPTATSRRWRGGRRSRAPRASSRPRRTRCASATSRCRACRSGYSRCAW